MRSHPAFFAIFASLFLLPACDSIEKKVEQKAEAAVAERAEKAGVPLPASTTFEGITTTKGLCSGWPSSVPLEPGARNVFCQTMDPKQAESSPQFQLWLATHPDAQPKPGDEPVMAQTFMLTFEIAATEDEVDAFYRKNLKGSLAPAPLPMPVPMTPLLSRKPTASDPLMFVFRVRSLDSTPGTTHVALMVAANRPL